MLAATAATALGLGLLGCVEWWQDWEGLSDQRDSWWRWGFLEKGTGKVVVKVVAKEVGVTDVRRGGAAVLE